MTPCEGCSGKFKENECYVALKDKEFNLHIYTITPEICPCQNCIVKMICKEFCEDARLNAKNFGVEIDV